MPPGYTLLRHWDHRIHGRPSKDLLDNLPLAEAMVLLETYALLGSRNHDFLLVAVVEVMYVLPGLQLH